MHVNTLNPHDRLALRRPGEFPGSRPPGVLIVNRLPLTLALLKVELQPHGFAVWLASDAAEALQLFRRHYRDIDLVLIDIPASELEDSALIERFRQLKPEVAVHLLTAENDAWNRDDRRRLDEALVIRKPVSPPTVARLVSQALAQAV